MRSPARPRDVVLNTLKGEKIESVHVKPNTGATRLVFDLGGVLEINRVERGEPEDLWMLYQPRGFVLTVRSDGTYAHGPGTATKERWKPGEITRGAA